MIVGAIKPNGDDTEELSMKAPMSVSKLVDLGKRARTWVKLRVPCLLLPSALDAQFGTPYPRSAGFDTDIGAFIESSSVPSPSGPMAPTIINGDVVQGETFLPRQIFVFSSFTLRANSLGHLEQIESYAPGRQVRF